MIEYNLFVQHLNTDENKCDRKIDLLGNFSTKIGAIDCFQQFVLTVFPGTFSSLGNYLQYASKILSECYVYALYDCSGIYVFSITTNTKQECREIEEVVFDIFVGDQLLTTIQLDITGKYYLESSWNNGVSGLFTYRGCVYKATLQRYEGNILGSILFLGDVLYLDKELCNCSGKMCSHQEMINENWSIQNVKAKYSSDK